MALYIKKPDLDEYLDHINLDSFREATLPYSLDNLIQSVNDREQAMLNEVFGTSGMTREDLINGIRKIQNTYTGLTKLNDNTLRQIVLQYAAKIGDVSAREEKEFQLQLIQAWNEFQPSSQSEKTVENLILQIANETFEKHKNDYLSFKTKAAQDKAKTALGQRRVGALPSFGKDLTKSEEDKLRHVYLSDLAEVTQKRIRKWLKDRKIEAREGALTSGVKETPTNLIVNTDLDWYAYTQGRAGKSAEQQYSDATLQKRFEAFKADFKAMIGADVPHIDEILDHVFQRDKTAIFVGANTNAIIGLSGEIQALCYLATLLGDRFELSPQALNWTATKSDEKEFGSGKQYHADVTLKEFGIQVKNSIKDIIDKVSFVNSTLDTFLYKLVEERIISEEGYEELMSLAEARFFNIPYVYSIFEDDDEHHVLAVGETDVNPAFQETRAKIMILYQTFEIILQWLVGRLLYIGVGNAAKDEIGNVLFFVKGEPIFASEILMDIKESIDEEIQNFQAQIQYRSSFTIIDLLNAKGLEAYNYPQATARMFDQSVRSKIYLTSSYNFETLYTQRSHK